MDCSSFTEYQEILKMVVFISQTSAWFCARAAAGVANVSTGDRDLLGQWIVSTLVSWLSSSFPFQPILEIFP